MTHTSTDRRSLLPLTWAAAPFVALALTAAFVGVSWLRSADGRAWPALATAAALALAAVFGTAWLGRARAARRRLDAVNAYAEREIARDEVRKTRNRTGIARRRGAVVQ